jgi:Tfp pilus assembly protein FimV
MDKPKTVTINGQRYDAVTGMPVATAPKRVVDKNPTQSNQIHRTPQRSQTLVRRAAKKPTAPIKGPGRSMDIARSTKIARFAPHPVAPKPVVTSKPDIAARTHPVAAKAHVAQQQRHVANTKPVSKTAQTIKEDAIVAALATPPPKPIKKSFFKRHPRFISVGSIIAIVALLGGYLTYVNMPGLSVRVASAQAGIEASYPDYRPDGYSLNGPVTFSDGEVTMKFVANTGSSSFTLTQEKSSWDSSAVLNNIVKDAAGDKYITSQERGLTIYTYSGNAAWVNAGILYTIEGDAPLSGEQIRRIATSL